VNELIEGRRKSPFCFLSDALFYQHMSAIKQRDWVHV